MKVGFLALTCASPAPHVRVVKPAWRVARLSSLHCMQHAFLYCGRQGRGTARPSLTANEVQLPEFRELCGRRQLRCSTAAAETVFNRALTENAPKDGTECSKITEY